MFSGSPFYAPPSKETEQTRRILAKLNEREDTGAVVFRVLKGWNDNVVVYEYDADADEPLKALWISIDPVDEKTHSERGNPSLRSPLNAAEEMIFGCRVNVVEGDRHLIVINVEQLSKRVFELVLDKTGSPAIIGVINLTLCRLHHAYAHMRHGIIPSVERLMLYGTSIESGERVVEEIRG